MIDERAIEAGQVSQPAHPGQPTGQTAGYFEPAELTILAKRGRLYLVADSIGGGSGQVAGQYATRKILHEFYSGDIVDPEERLLALVQQVNADLLARNQDYPERRPLATTLTAALIRNNKLFAANVGDSRVYVVWGQDIEQLGQEADQPAAKAEPAQAEQKPQPKGQPTGQPTAESEPQPEKSAEKADQPAPEPEVSPEKPGETSSESTAEPDSPSSNETPDESPEKSQPSGPPAQPQLPQQALGLAQSVKIDIFTRRLFAGDTIVLCSGSLTGYLTEPEIVRAVNRYSPAEASQRLVALAAERGNRDQVGLSIARVLSQPVATQPPSSMTLPSKPAWSDWETPPRPAEPSSPTGRLPALPAQARAAQTKSSLTPIDRLPHQRLPWLLAGLIGLLLCVALWLVWQYALPANIVASVPVVGDYVGGMREEAAEVVVPLPEEDEAAEPVGTVEAQASLTATMILSATAPLAGEANSPLPTPPAAATTTSPASSPTPGQGSLTEAVTTATPSPTPLPTIDLPADCTNRARFVRDVTVPDGTEFAPAEKFEKTWLLLNAETCPWGPGYTVRFIDGDQMGAAEVIPLREVVPPDSNGEIRVPMIAPAVPGQYRGDWQLYDLNGEPFGPEMYLEIEVVPPDLGDVAELNLTTLYDFVAQAPEASWRSGPSSYEVRAVEIDESLELPAPEGLVASGTALLRGNRQSEQPVLLTYPHQELGVVEGTYIVDTPLQPTDAVAATLGFIKLSILSDDGVTFEVVFSPADGGEEQVVLSRTVQYRDSPVTELQPLAGITPGQQGTFTLRVVGGESLRQDWAVWLDARLIRIEE